MISSHRVKMSLRTSFGLVAVCAAIGIACCASVRAAEEPPHPAAIDDAIIAAAKRHGVPEHLIRRIIMRESKYNPRARNRLYWGLMQISYPTAKSMGFKGTREQLLDPIVNLRYAVPYLANAYQIAGKTEDAAVRLYAAGYYYTARGRGMLTALRTADSAPLSGEPAPEPMLAANANAQPPQSVGIFGALFGPGQQPAPQPQAASYAADASAQPQPAVVAQASSAPAGTFDAKPVDMVVGKNGEAAPPKKWVHDGGTTQIARGEQATDQLARGATSDKVKSAHRKARKITMVAALDLPPSTAQAYAGGQDPRFAAAQSQAAIAQATSGQAPTEQPLVQQVDSAGQAVVAGQAPAPEVKPTVAEEDKPKARRTRHASRKKAKAAETKEARATAPASDAPAAPPTAEAPQLRP